MEKECSWNCLSEVHTAVGLCLHLAAVADRFTFSPGSLSVWPAGEKDMHYTSLPLSPFPPSGPPSLPPSLPHPLTEVDFVEWRASHVVHPTAVDKRSQPFVIIMWPNVACHMNITRPYFSWWCHLWSSICSQPLWEVYLHLYWVSFPSLSLSHLPTRSSTIVDK